MRLLKQNTATNVMIFLTSSIDHITGGSGLTLTITSSKDGGAFGSITPTVTERGDGWYNFSLTSGHTDTLGDLAIHVTASGADNADMLCRVVAGELDATISSRSTLTADDIPDVDTGSIADAVLSEPVGDHLTAGSLGAVIDLLRKITGNKVVRIGDTLRIYEDDGESIWKVFDVSNFGRVEE